MGHPHALHTHPTNPTNYIPNFNPLSSNRPPRTSLSLLRNGYNARFPSPSALLDYVTPYISQSWTADFDGHPAETSFTRHFHLHLHIMETNPEYAAEVLNVSTIADEGEGRADVMMLLEIKGRPRGTRRQTLVVLRWRRGWEGQWKWVHLSSMRGIGVGFREAIGYA